MSIALYDWRGRRVAINASSHLEAEPAAELQRLKVVGLQHDLATVPLPGLLLSG
jgi:hypothetical protein